MPNVIITIKTEEKLKAQATKLADELGLSLSAVLNNALRNFVVDKKVVFESLETPNKETAAALKKSKKRVDAGDYHSFDSNEEALSFLDSL